MSKMEQLKRRLENAKQERERIRVHPDRCECKGHGNIPQSQFAIGFVRCEKNWGVI